MRHQCDYCPWFNGVWCDCPYVMRSIACDKAKRKKEQTERGKDIKLSN